MGYHVSRQHHNNKIIHNVNEKFVEPHTPWYIIPNNSTDMHRNNETKPQEKCHRTPREHLLCRMNENSKYKNLK